jgi:linoleoyl-CoA desaturase
MSFPTHLSDAAIEELGGELDAIRDEVMESRGERDRRYILRLIAIQRAGAWRADRHLRQPALLPEWNHALASWTAFWRSSGSAR